MVLSKSTGVFPIKSLQHASYGGVKCKKLLTQRWGNNRLYFGARAGMGKEDYKDCETFKKGTAKVQGNKQVEDKSWRMAASNKQELTTAKAVVVEKEEEGVLATAWTKSKEDYEMFQEFELFQEGAAKHDKKVGGDEFEQYKRWRMRNKTHDAGIEDTSKVCADDDLGPLGKNLDFEQVMKETEARGAILPPELLTAAENTGIPELCLYRYLFMQDDYGLGFGFAMKSWSMVRNQMMIDPMYLIRLAKMFGLTMFLDVGLATLMYWIVRDSRLIVIFSWIRFFQKVVSEGLIAPQKYAQRIMRQLEGFSHYSMFLAERAVSLGQGAIAFGRIYCVASLIFTLCMIRLFE